MTTAKQGAQTLIDEFMPFAKMMLTDYQEFLPFGGHMKLDGEIVHEGATTGEEQSASQDLIDILRSAHRQQAEEQSIVAACIVYDMRIIPPNRTEKQDAIAFEVDHRDGYSGVIVYPYRFAEDNTPITEAPFAIRGESGIFPPSTNNNLRSRTSRGAPTGHKLFNFISTSLQPRRWAHI